MKAITIYQPWASLLACGAKRYETRSWATKYRGSIAIHAGAKRPPKSLGFEVDRAVANNLKHLFYRFDGTFNEIYQWVVNNLDYGMVIATAELVGCHYIGVDDFGKTRILFDEKCANGIKYDALYDEIPEDSDEFLCGDWSAERFAWEFKNMKLLPEPIPAKGQQRLWETVTLHLMDLILIEKSEEPQIQKLGGERLPRADEIKLLNTLDKTIDLFLDNK